jgi:hypothetical protein
MDARGGRRTRTKVKQTQFSGQFIGRLVEMLESYAYRVLSLSAHRVLDRIEIEFARHGGKAEENGRLPVTYSDFESYGIDRHAIRPAIQEALALGFIEITECGTAGNREFRSPNKFRLTYRPAKGIPGDGSHEWRLFRSIEDAMNTARRARTGRFDRIHKPPNRVESQKQKTSVGKRHVSLGETHTENIIPMRKPQ